MFHFLQKCPCSQDYSELVGQCWLQSARVARKAGHHQTAYNALLNAGESTLSELYVERAKWLWSKVRKTKTEFHFLHAKKRHTISTCKARYVCWDYQHIAADPPGAGKPCSIAIDLPGTFV